MARHSRPSAEGRSVTAASNSVTTTTAPKRLSLRDAMLEAADPVDRAELTSLEPEGYVIGKLMSLPPRARRYLDLRNRAEATLRARLTEGELIATGRDSRDFFGLRLPVPADRWPYLKFDYEKSAVENEGTRIIEIQISTVGGLHISIIFRRARLGIIVLDLSDRSFDLLVMLAEGAQKGDPLVRLEELKKKLFSKVSDEKALGQGINTLREHLVRSGLDAKLVELLIRNVRGEGYLLALPAAEILIERPGS